MARRKDIAGLAALGALGMMLNNKGKDTGSSNRDTDTGVDVQPPSSSDTRDYGIDYSEAPQNSSAPTRTEKKPASPATKRPSGKINPELARSARSESSAVNGGPRRGPAFESGSAGQKGPGFGEEAAYRQQQYEAAQAQANTPQGRAERQSQIEAQAVKPVRPEEYLVGGGSMAGLKTVAGLAKGLANRQASRGVEKAAEYSQPAIGYAERKLLEGGGKRPLLDGPPKRLTGPASKEADDVAETGREAVTNPMAWMAGPKGMREDFKRGGKVKKMASGGSVKSSASSRGDGIAMRGKTRGMMR